MKTLKACFKDEQRLDTAVQALFGLMMAVVIAACLFLSWILYAKKQNTLPNILLLPAGLFFGICHRMGCESPYAGCAPGA